MMLSRGARGWMSLLGGARCLKNLFTWDVCADMEGYRMLAPFR